MTEPDRDMTPERRRWLERLLNEGTLSKRGGHGRAPMFCMRAGWSEWVYRREETDETLGAAELDANYPDMWRGPDFARFKAIGEQITPAGRAALRSQGEG